MKKNELKSQIQEISKDELKSILGGAAKELKMPKSEKKEGEEDFCDTTCVVCTNCVFSVGGGGDSTQVQSYPLTEL